MLIRWLCWALFGGAALACCVLTSLAVLRHDKRAHFYLMLSGAFAVTFFITVPNPPYEMIAVALLAIAAGVLLAPPAEGPPEISLDTTARRRH